jgi:hypothetical protein
METKEENKTTEKEIKEKTIKIGSTEDIKNLLEKVRTEEKNKLYPQIEQLGNMLEQSEKEKQELLKRIEELETIVMDKSSTKKEKTDASDEIEALKGMYAEMMEQNAILKAQIDATKNTYEEELKNLRLEAYRNEVIAKAGGRIIPELVWGDSEAEIDAAAIDSMRKYEEIEQDIKQEINEKLKKERKEAKVPGIGGTPPLNQSVNASSPQELTEDMIKNMSAEEWAKNRDHIRSQINSQMKSFFKRG